MSSRSFSFTAKVCALLLLSAAGALLSGSAGFGPGEQSAEAAPFNEAKMLLASDAQAEDFFGQSVAISGNTAVVGAFGEDAGSDNAGGAYVFARDKGGAGNWGEVKKLTASDAEAGGAFAVSVAVSGDTAVAGAIGEDARGSFAGAAYVFGRDQGGADNWGEVKKLLASDAQVDDWFGFSVAISGDKAVVGAYRVDAGANDGGAAYVFGRDQGGADNWGEVKKLLASDVGAEDWFGYSLAISGDTAVVGAVSGDAGSSITGAAYVFQRDQGGAGNWGQVTKLTASDAQTHDEFGVSVAVSGDAAVVGAQGEDARGNLAGAAYVFQRDEGGTNNWGEVKKLTASDAQVTHFFGSVAVSGNTAVVGASGATDVGAAYVFGRDQGGADNWGEVRKLTASDPQARDALGRSVAVSGDTVVAGAPQEDAAASEAGAAYVFDLLLPKPTSTPTATAVTTPPGTPQLGPTATVAAVSLPQTGPGGDGAGGVAVLSWLAAGVAGALVVGGAGWYARRRRR